MRRKIDVPMKGKIVMRKNPMEELKKVVGLNTSTAARKIGVSRFTVVKWRKQYPDVVSDAPESK